MERIVQQVGVVVLAVVMLIALWALDAGWRRLIRRCPSAPIAPRHGSAGDAWLQRLGLMLLLGMLLVTTALLPL
ncbi:MAG TPA: hypothetical protein VF210_11755 [Pseudomonadales bacterium]